jgi:uncharacterized protein (DUF305 family)
MLLKKTLRSFLMVGMVHLASLGLIACGGTSSSDISPNNNPASDRSLNSATETDFGSSQTNGSMDHGSMDHGSMAHMDLGPADDSFDLRFIDAMIPHHEGAVVMAQEALQKSNRPEIKQLAAAIIQAQDPEIAAMKGWRTDWYPNVGEEPVMYSAEMGHTMPMTEEMRSAMMMTGDLGAADEQFDLRFLQAMIPHHEGAIEMAKQVLEKSDRPEVKELAEQIMDSQQKEIDQMQQWQKDWYGQ